MMTGFSHEDALPKMTAVLSSRPDRTSAYVPPLTPFVDFPGEYGPASYRFEWEREWRIPGDLLFKPEDVKFLFIPAELHEKARGFFANAEEEGIGPNYTCPYLDPTWGIEDIQEALDGL